MKKITSLVLRTAGINCDAETVRALKLAGSDQVDLHHINRLKEEKSLFKKYDFIVIPGGFTYGDTVSAGKILANETKFIFKEEMKDFLNRGKLLLGICNGFQVLVKSGILSDRKDSPQSYSLIRNDSKRFECRWIYLKSTGSNFWTKGLPEVIALPIAHGEGKFVTDNKATLNKLKDKSIAFRYCDANGNTDNISFPDNPNGSSLGIAGIIDPTEQILGMMPHPERFVYEHQHPWYHTLRANEKKIVPFGLQIFKNAVEKLKK
ncbi:MAG: phosphoribosylformylglycinamidine synthase I [Spirochaetes bacterium]|nr:phosphoribosylformylglycinamidine synthase I [Spirochaetota bacterium]